MRKIALGILIGVVVFSVGVALAGKPTASPEEWVTGDIGPSQGHASVIIPDTAVEVAPGVFYLGEAVEKGKAVEGYAFIDYKKGFGKPTGCNEDGKCQGWEDPGCVDCENGGNGGGDTSKCYGFLAKGAKWKVIEPYIVNPDNNEGLTSDFVSTNLALDISKWEDAADGTVDGSQGADILGGGSTTSDILVADTSSPDDQNEVYFADVDSPGAIAVTIVWGIFRGPPSQRELVEWDQVYDDYDFDWSADCTSESCVSKMDFENIATHELGHPVGLDDLYEDKCSEQTMYGYASYGETKKRTLEAGDINGIQELYK